MQSTATFSPSDRATIETSLARMTGDAFGALATLPLFCLGQLPSPDPEAAIHEHFEVWHSCLIVIREVIKAAGAKGDRDTHAAVAALLDVVGDLRDAYIDIHHFHRAEPQRAADTVKRLQAAYDRMPSLVRDLAARLELESPFLPGPRSLKSVLPQRNLQWLSDEIQREMAGNRNG
ncbi:MAG TPA: hypothetical protein VK797_09090 [Tepidisphaeraceae bacterium]|nr:hypothetical protein [Tepidisphaeraceae bacterium]